MLSIGSFSKIAGIPTKTLRYYDEIGLLKPRCVDGGSGYRFYEVSQLESVLLISRLKRYGFSLEEIARILKNPRDNTALLPLFTQKKQDMEEMLASYTGIVKRLESDIANLEKGNDLMSYLDAIPVNLVETKPVILLSVRREIDVRKEYGELLAGLMKNAEEGGLTAGSPISIFHGEEFDPAHYDMEIAVPVKKAGNGTRELPAFLCAHATLKGDYSGLPSVYAKIRKWMEAEGYATAEAPFESYETNPHLTPPEENITEVYFPVKKR